MSFVREQIVKRLTRSSGWSKIRKQHLKKNPLCAACGKNKFGTLEVHHIQSFHEFPELELDPNNLITLCSGGCNCHLTLGHCGNFKLTNPTVIENANYQLSFFNKVKNLN